MHHFLYILSFTSNTLFGAFWPSSPQSLLLYRRDETISVASSLVWQVQIIKPDMPNDAILCASELVVAYKFCAYLVALE